MINLDPTASAVLLVGDLHGNTRWGCAVIDKAREILDTDRPLLIQVGDFGIWQGSGGQTYLRELTSALTENNAELLFLDGNHENHYMLKNFMLTKMNSDGTVQVTDRIRYLPRGYRFSLGRPNLKRTFLVLGGAVSVDKAFRTEDIDWWREEVLTQDQVDNAISGGHAWCMLTHDAPHTVQILLPPPPKGWHPYDLEMAQQHRELMTTVTDAVQPKLLIHGHYHFRLQQTVGEMRVTSLSTDGENGNIAVLDLETGHVS